MLDIDSAQQDLQGKVKIVSGALTVEPGAVFALDVDPEDGSCEQVEFCSYAENVTLAGKVRLVSSVKNGLVGTSWPIMKVTANTATAGVTCSLKSAPDGIGAVFSVSGDSENGWVVTATAVPNGLTITIK